MTLLERVCGLEHRIATAPRQLLLQPDEHQMNNFNRKQRRALAKKNRKAPNQELQAAGKQVNTAIEALRKLEGLEGTAKTLQGLGTKIDAALKAMEGLAQDVQTLGFELEVQREVNLRLLSRLYANVEYPEAKALKDLKGMEEKVRESLVDALVKEQVEGGG